VVLFIYNADHMKPVNAKLSERIRSLRKKYGYTQAKLAELSGVEYKHIQLLESKKPSDARLSTIEKIAKAFNLSIAEFIDL